MDREVSNFQVGSGVIKEERDGMTVYASGATRSSDVGHLRYDLISTDGLRELAEVYAQGAKVHGDENWKKGMDPGVIINHAMEHLMKYIEGDRSELHAAKVAWGMFALIHFDHQTKKWNGDE